VLEGPEKYKLEPAHNALSELPILARRRTLCSGLRADPWAPISGLALLEDLDSANRPRLARGEVGLLQPHPEVDDVVRPPTNVIVSSPSDHNCLVHAVSKAEFSASS
jgi:hypothetical protein